MGNECLRGLCREEKQRACCKANRAISHVMNVSGHIGRVDYSGRVRIIENGGGPGD